MTKMVLTIGREVFGKKEAYDVFQDALAMYFTEDDACSVSVPQSGVKRECVESYER